MQPNKESKPQAHNLTTEEIKNLHDQQKQGKAVERVAANIKSGYTIPANEQHLVHVALRIPGVDEHTEKPLHPEFVQCFYPDVFSSMDKGGAFKGYKAVIIHDPRTATQKVEDLNNDKVVPLGRMNKEQLQARYLEVFTDVTEVPAELKDNEALRGAIQEKLDFLAKEAEAEKAAKDDKGKK